MTEADAYRVLGVSRSTDRSRPERLYLQKCRQLRLRMVPGMPVATRQKAQAELARVDAAWQVIRASGPAGPAAKKPAARKTATPSSPHALPYQKPQTLGEAWDQVASVMPFSESVTATVLILVSLITLTALLTSL